MANPIRPSQSSWKKCWLPVFFFGLFSIVHSETPQKPNVLFIGVDDLRPALGCYGDKLAITPHLDALARRGTVFTNAYCQVASCHPSRTSILTGLRVKTTGVRGNRDGSFRKRLSEHVPLPQHFKNNGWFTRAFGKVYHVQDPQSWSTRKFLPKAEFGYPIYGKPVTLELQKTIRATHKPQDWWGYQKGRNDKWAKASSWEDPDVSDEVLFDGQVATAVIESLRKNKSRPFFLAPGFFRPHLPFVAPRKYFEKHPKSSFQLPANRSLPKNVPSFAHYNSAESRSYTDISRSGNIPEAKQLELLRGYYASVSYVDTQIGRVLKELDTLGIADRTIVVVWSDHGYHFGEHGTWNKYTNFEEATRSTLIVSAPGQAQTGSHSKGVVEMLDIYPTLCELAGLNIPSSLEGQSFAKLLDQPCLPGKSAAFSQASPGKALGRTLRTYNYRYTRWTKGEETLAEELYHHQTDPGENENLVPKAEHQKLLQQLREQFDAHWQKDS